MDPRDKPDDKTIENDDALDRWWVQFLADQARALAKYGGSGPTVTYNDAADALPTFQG